MIISRFHYYEIIECIFHSMDQTWTEWPLGRLKNAWVSRPGNTVIMTLSPQNGQKSRTPVWAGQHPNQL
jgi:hypothetical protein